MLCPIAVTPTAWLAWKNRVHLHINWWHSSIDSTVQLISDGVQKNILHIQDQPCHLLKSSLQQTKHPILQVLQCHGTLSLLDQSCRYDIFTPFNFQRATRQFNHTILKEEQTPCINYNYSSTILIYVDAPNWVHKKGSNSIWRCSSRKGLDLLQK